MKAESSLLQEIFGRKGEREVWWLEVSGVSRRSGRRFIFLNYCREACVKNGVVFLNLNPAEPTHAHAHHTFQAEKLLSEMLDAGLTPNVVTYTSLMVVLRRGGQPEKSIKILDLMKSKVSNIMAETLQYTAKAKYHNHQRQMGRGHAGRARPLRHD